MIQSIRTMFLSLHPIYWIRHYFFSGSLTLLFYSLGLGHISPLFLILSFLLYPLARYAYDAILSFLLGDAIWFVSGFFAVIWGILKIGLLYSFSLFIAPIGFLFLYLTSKQ